MVITENLYAEYLAVLLRGERQRCGAIVTDLLDAEVPLQAIYLELFQRSLYEIGSLWEANRVSVATEHLATAITEQLLTLAYPRLFRQPQNGRRAVIACVADEYHQVGAKIAADYLQWHGWDTQFLGANTPVAEVRKMLREQPCDLLGLSLSVYFNIPRLLDSLAELRDGFPELPIIVGGQAFLHGGAAAVTAVPGVRLFTALGQLAAA